MAKRRRQPSSFGLFPFYLSLFFLSERAAVLRAVSEDEDLRAKEKNRAFVLMQYFGYLRRDPDEGQDTNLDGFNHWLQKLEQFGGDYKRAEMVKAFLSATEYRDRFRQ